MNPSKLQKSNDVPPPPATPRKARFGLVSKVEIPACDPSYTPHFPLGTLPLSGSTLTT
ncbi:unnamed protein product [Penicillium camemberti]|uniref:Str. FM013 n=1 Tax=Penicillium camemberti (strain FM 013) TaxID=1429867 RepID=A0A0G4PCT5_PENC3|nr:unnamed protein product [Penicillium camemberti]